MRMVFVRNSSIIIVHRIHHNHRLDRLCHRHCSPIQMPSNQRNRPIRMPSNRQLSTIFSQYLINKTILIPDRMEILPKSNNTNNNWYVNCFQFINIWILTKCKNSNETGTKKKTVGNRIEGRKVKVKDV